MKKMISRRLVALCMAFAMMFSLLTVVHAEGSNDGLSAPTTHTEVAKPATINSISVGSATAYYETDDNTGNTTYIRALLTGKTEYYSNLIPEKRKVIATSPESGRPE